MTMNTEADDNAEQASLNGPLNNNRPVSSENADPKSSFSQPQQPHDDNSVLKPIPSKNMKHAFDGLPGHVSSSKVGQTHTRTPSSKSEELNGDGSRSRHHSQDYALSGSGTGTGSATFPRPHPVGMKSHSHLSTRSGFHSRDGSNSSVSTHSRQKSFQVQNADSFGQNSSSPALPGVPSGLEGPSNSASKLPGYGPPLEKPTLILYPRRSIIVSGGGSGLNVGVNMGSQTSFHSSDNVSAASPTESRENITIHGAVVNAGQYASATFSYNPGVRNSIQSIPEGQVVNAISSLSLSNPQQLGVGTSTTLGRGNKTSRESFLGSRASLLARNFNRTGITSYLGPSQPGVGISASGINGPSNEALAAAGVNDTSTIQNILQAMPSLANRRGSQMSALSMSMNARRGSMLGMTQDGQVVNLTALQQQMSMGTTGGSTTNHRMSMEPPSRSRPVSIISVKQLMKLKEAAVATEPSNEEDARVNLHDDDQKEVKGIPEGDVAPAAEAMPEVYQNTEYFDYVMYSQRHASMNFITRIDSSELQWETTQKQLPLKMIGRYLLGDKIGKGAFAKVKEGICSETLQRVAVKIISKKRLRKVQHGVENTLREIKLLRRLKHKNIVTLVDVFAKVEDDTGNMGIFPWFSSIEEEPIVWLFDDEGKKLPIDEAHRYFVQLMEGISYLHSQSVVHRDIKPGNLLITTDGVLKISDFGVAEQFDMYSEGEMMSEVFAGTHQFLSPEVVEGCSAFDGTKVDVWACGVTLFNMVTGRFPFELNEDNDLMQLYESIQTAKFQFPEPVPKDLEELFQGMLEKSAEKRLSDEQVLSHVWTRTYFHAKTAPHILAYPPLGSADSAEPSPDTPSPSHGPRSSSSFQATSPTSQKAGSIGFKTPPTQSIIPHESSHTQSLVSSPVEKTSVPLEPVAVEITPTESTMIPYLESMYQQEIETDLAASRGVSEWLQTDSSESLNEKGKKKKLKGIFRGLFGNQKSPTSPKRK